MYLFLLATLASCQSCSSDYKDVDDIVVEGVETPVLLGDPFIMLHDGTYYAYGTHADEGIEVYTSDDLKTWKYKGRIFNGANRLRGEKRRMPSIRQLHTAFTECSMKKTQSPASPICRTNYANSFTTIHASRVVIPIIKERAANTTRK